MSRSSASRREAGRGSATRGSGTSGHGPSGHGQPTFPALQTIAVVPFVVCTAIGFLLLLLPPYHRTLSEYVSSGVLLVIVLGSAVILPWQRWPSWTHAIPPLSFFAVIAVMLDLSGGVNSPLIAMVAVPVLWLALFGSRWALHAAALATGLVCLLPLVLIGGADYPLSEWRRGVMWMAVVWIVVPFVQAVVRRLGDRERELVRLNADLQAADRQWQLFAGQLPDTVILIVDADLRYEMIAGAGMLRQRMEQWVGLTLFETSSPDNIALLEPLYRRALAGERGEIELSATNTRHLHQVTAVPFVHHGRSSAMVVAFDVSAAQGREDEVRALNTTVERLIDEAPTGVCVADLEGRVLRVNSALRTLLDLPPGSTADGTTLASLGLVPDMAAVTASLSQSPTGRYAVEVQREHGTGDTVVIDVAVASVKDPAGRPDTLLVHAHDISERRRFEERLEHLASHDPLTGLANRRRFDTALGQHLLDSNRTGSRGAVLMLDLDQFKEVNDTFGHGVGDQLIVSVGALLRNMLPATDTVARLGGDEFAILLPRGGRDEAELVARQIVEEVRSRASTIEPRFARPLTVSVGVVMVNEATTSAADLLVAVDMTMYDAKDAGRDRYEIFDARDSASPYTAARISWAGRIRQALREDRFVLYAQPVVYLLTREVTGAELLLRMLDDDGSLIPPARFLHVADRMGLAPAVDRWVIGRAVILLEQTVAAGRPLRLSVNVSAHSLNDLDFVDAIEDLLHAAAIDPRLLVFEITETAAIANMERARTFADRLHALGCLLALDDFGAGHASFYYLKHLPFDLIKIDGEFVRSCTTNTFDRLVIDSVVAFSAGTGRRVVAEYVGDEATALALRDMRVDLGQGFHLGRPQPWDEFLRDNGITSATLSS